MGNGTRAVGEANDGSFYTATLSGLLELAQAQLYGEVVGRLSRERAKAATSGVPAAAAGFFGFERPLGNNRTDCDFAFSLSTFGLRWLISEARWPQAASLVGAFWEKLPEAAETVWLEFDTGTSLASGAPPNLFVGLDRSAISSRAIPSIVDNVHATMLFQHLGACAPSAKVQLGFMLSRASRALRFCALTLRYEETLEFLAAAAWPGNLDDVAAAIAPYAPLCDGFGVHIDLLDGVLPALGLELLYNGSAPDHQPDREPRWFALFGRLIADGLCLERERDDLLGCVSATRFEAPLIERLVARAFPSGEALLHGTLYTGLQHVKLTINSERGPSAKAYFGASLEAEPYS